jgi:hypothetical protein
LIAEVRVSIRELAEVCDVNAVPDRPKAEVPAALIVTEIVSLDVVPTRKLTPPE